LKYGCLEPLNGAQVIARNTYGRINDSIADFFRDLGGVENLPAAFDVTDEGWLQMQREIDEAAAAFNIEKTVKLCQEYDRRASAYFDRWRKKLEKQNGHSSNDRTIGG
jgi:hypothetical protein